MTECNHAAAERLVEYVRGELSGGDRLEVDRHVESCPVCAERLDTLRLLGSAAAEAEARMFAPHVEVELLQRFVDDPVALDEAARREVSGHLEVCGDCAHAARAMRSVNATIAAKGTADAASAAAVPWWREWLAGWRWQAAIPAAAVFLVLFYPAMVGLDALLHGASETGSPARIVEAPLVLHALTLRGDEVDLPGVSAGTPRTLELRAPFRTGDGTRYDVRLEDAGGRVLWQSSDVASTDAFGALRVEIDATSLEAGRYVMVVAETDTETGSVAHQFDFAFEILVAR